MIIFVALLTVCTVSLLGMLVRLLRDLITNPVSAILSVLELIAVYLALVTAGLLLYSWWTRHPLRGDEVALLIGVAVASIVVGSAARWARARWNRRVGF